MLSYRFDLEGVPMMSPWRDMQDVPPKGYCLECGAELYEYDDEDYCPVCLEAKNERDID